jgi:tRNA-dihydrouridine synthase 2
MIEATGIKALAVHCRYRDERPRREKAHWDRFKEIVDAVSIPVIANGDVMEYGHLSRLQELSGVTAVMYARKAESNVSIFRKEGPLPHMEVVREYVRRVRDMGQKSCRQSCHKCS